MKNNFIFGIFIFIFTTSYCFACCEVVCPSSIADGFKETQEQSLNSTYDQIKQQLKNVKKQYEALYENLKTSNEKLETAINVSKDKLLNEKEILFLLKQSLQMQSLQVDIME